MIGPTAPHLYAGQDQSDVAMLVADGETYYCVVWLDRGKWRIEAACFVELEDGERVRVFENVVYQMPQDDIDAGFVLDCPRILASGTNFIVHFIRQTGTDGSFNRLVTLDRYSMDMTAFVPTSWTYRSAQVLYHYALYDAQPVQGHASDFIVAFATSDDQFTVNRHDGPAWVDIAWTTDVDATGLGLADFIIHPRVLACYAHEGDNDVAVVVQRFTIGAAPNNGPLVAIHLDADTGAGLAMGTAMSQFTSGYYLNAALCRIGAASAVLIAECLTFIAFAGFNEQLSYVHHVGYTRVNTGTGAFAGNQQATSNVTLHSRPWAFPSGRASDGSDFDVYAVIGYKSATLVNDWAQAYYYVCNLDRHLWDAHAGPASDGEGLNWGSVTPVPTGVRARPISTIYTVGVPDARPAGTTISNGDAILSRGPSRRMNHLSSVAGAPTFGPNCKSRTIAIGLWAQQQPSRAESGESELQPANAGVSAIVAFMEDPWALWRETATQPVDNFAGAYSRAMCQGNEIGRSLFMSGGTPYVYDGSQVTECGYVYQPEILLAEAQTLSGGASGLSNGSYQAYVVWTRRDRSGQLHRSGPSNIVSITVAGLNNVVYLRVRPMALSIFDAEALSDSADAIMIEVYRTRANDPSLFYREYGASVLTTGAVNPDFRPRDTPINNPNAAYIDVPFATPDANVEDQGLGPYQYGTNVAAGLIGVLPQTPPAMTATTTWLNRQWGADALDPAVLWYSDEVLPDYGSTYYQGLAWNGAQTFRIGEYGDIQVLRAMNNALILMTSRGYVLALSADPAGTVEQPALLSITVEVLHEGVVCVDPRTVVLYPHGIGFQSPKGYMLLSRSREVGYGALTRSRDEPQSTAGAAIEDDIREAGNVRSATLMESEQQIRLSTNGRPAVVNSTIFTVTNAAIGTWTLTLGGVPISVAGAATVSVIVDNFVAAITEAIDDFRLRDIAVLALDGFTVFSVTWADDVEPDYTVSVPVGSSLTGVETQQIRTRPRVLIYQYDLQQWSRAELPQTNTATRLAEVVDGCTWRGPRGNDLHVVLTQGGLLIERPVGDALAFADGTPTGDVAVPIDLTWSWVHLAAISGYVRTWEIIVQTERTENAPLAAYLEYDRSGDFNGQQILPNLYEWPRPGQTVTPADLRIKPRVQQARAYRLRLFEDSTSPLTANLSVVGLTFHVGAQQGPAKVANAHRGGVS